MEEQLFGRQEDFDGRVGMGEGFKMREGKELNQQERSAR